MSSYKNGIRVSNHTHTEYYYTEYSDIIFDSFYVNVRLQKGNINNASSYEGDKEIEKEYIIIIDYEKIKNYINEECMQGDGEGFVKEELNDYYNEEVFFKERGIEYEMENLEKSIEKQINEFIEQRKQELEEEEEEEKKRIEEEEENGKNGEEEEEKRSIMKENSAKIKQMFPHKFKSNRIWKALCECDNDLEKAIEGLEQDKTRGGG